MPPRWIRPASPARAPKIGFVSLGCPKALTDSELILTRLRAEGYATAKTYAGADLVIVNTCGFIDDAVRESLDTIGEALAANGKVIVTGCLGAKAGEGGGNLVRQMHPSVLAVTGPHATDEVMDAVHAHLPKPHDPFVDLVPRRARIGVKLTPQALRLPEDQRRLQPPLHLLHHPEPARRPGLAAGRRRALGGRGAVRVGRQGAARHQPGHERLRRRRQRYRTGFWNGRPVKTQLLELCERLAEIAEPSRRLGAAALRLSVSACRRGPAADGDAARSCPISTCRSSTRTPTCCAG